MILERRIIAFSGHFINSACKENAKRKKASRNNFIFWIIPENEK